MDDGSNITAPADGSPRRTSPDAGPVDDRWAGRQRLFALVGAGLALAAVVCAVLGLTGLPARSGADGDAITAVVASAVLLIACAVLGWAWTAQLAAWRSGSGSERDRSTRSVVALVAHLTSYVAVLVAMYATLAASALAGWGSHSGSLLGITFLLVIAAQVVGGTQMLRRSGPPGTVPVYLRRLNAKVQSLR